MKNISYPLKVSGKALKHYRSKVEGLRQEDVAISLGITRPNYNAWEKKEWVEIDEKQAKVLEKSLHVSAQDLAVSPGDEKATMDVLDHPVIRSLVAQSEYIMQRVRELEEENKRLRGN